MDMDMDRKRLPVLGRVVMALVLLGCLIVLSIVPAVATSSSATSAPNGELTVSASLVSATNRDQDGNVDTATTRDVIVASAAVTNNAAATQTVTVTVALDAPGTVNDAAYPFPLRIRSGETKSLAVPFFVTRAFPRGQYLTTITAAGTESASATAVVTIN